MSIINTKLYEYGIEKNIPVKYLFIRNSLLKAEDNQDSFDSNNVISIFDYIKNSDVSYSLLYNDLYNMGYNFQDFIVLVSYTKNINLSFDDDVNPLRYIIDNDKDESIFKFFETVEDQDQLDQYIYNQLEEFKLDYEDEILNDKNILTEYYILNDNLKLMNVKPFTVPNSNTIISEIINYDIPSTHNILIDYFDIAKTNYTIPYIRYNDASGKMFVKVYKGVSDDISINYQNMIINNHAMKDNDTIYFLMGREILNKDSKTIRESYILCDIKYHEYKQSITVKFVTVKDETLSVKASIDMITKTFRIRKSSSNITSIESYNEFYYIPNDGGFFNNEVFGDVIMNVDVFAKIIHIDEVNNNFIVKNRLSVGLANYPNVSANISIESNDIDNVSFIKIVLVKLNNENVKNLFIDILSKVFSYMHDQKDLLKFYSSIIETNHRKYKNLEGSNNNVLNDEYINKINTIPKIEKNKIMKAIFPNISGYATSCQKVNQPYIISEKELIDTIKDTTNPDEYLIIHYDKYNSLLYNDIITSTIQSNVLSAFDNSYMYRLSSSLSSYENEVIEPIQFNMNYQKINSLFDNDNVIEDKENMTEELYNSLSERLVEHKSNLIQVIYNCDRTKTDKPRYPKIMNEVKNDNSLVADKNKYMVCCYTNNKTSETITVKAQAVNHVLTSNKILYNERRGVINEQLKNLLSSYYDNKGVFYRVGTSASANYNSFLYAVHKAVTSISATAEDISLLRENLSSFKDINGDTIHPEVLKQELYDYTVEQIVDTIKSVQYFDPLKFYRLVEEYYKIRIVVFDNDLVNNKIYIPPRNNLYHIVPDIYEDRNVVIVLSHKGSERDKPNTSNMIPQCEIIMYEDESSNVHYMYPPNLSTNILNNFLKYVNRVMSFSNVDNTTLTYNNVYNSYNFIKLINNIKYQVIDNNGKLRMVQFDNEDKKFFMFTYPYVPLNVPSINIEDLDLTGVLPSIKDIVDVIGLKPSSYNVEDDKIIGVWFSIKSQDDKYNSINNAFYFPCILEEVSSIENIVISKEVPPVVHPDIKKKQMISDITKFKKIRHNLLHLIKYAYIISSINNVDDFLKTFFVIDHNVKDEDYMNYYIPRILTGDSTFEVLTNIENENNSNLIDGALIKIYNEDMYKGIKYELEQINKDVKYNIHNLQVINDYYKYKNDFKENNREYLFVGSDEFNTWTDTVNALSTKKNKTYATYSSLSNDMFNIVEPFIYHYSNYSDIKSSIDPYKDEFYLVQNLPVLGRNSSFQQAMTICYNWIVNGNNIYIDQYDKVDGKSFIVYDIINNRIEEVARYGTGNHFSILRYVVRKNYYYAAMLKLN